MTTPKLAKLKARVRKLDETIRNEETKKFLLKLPKYWIGDVERDVVPQLGVDFVLTMIEQKVQIAEEAVVTYGADIQIVGGTGQG